MDRDDRSSRRFWRGPLGRVRRCSVDLLEARDLFWKTLGRKSPCYHALPFGDNILHRKATVEIEATRL